jgi:hypothetical protein
MRRWTLGKAPDSPAISRWSAVTNRVVTVMNAAGQAAESRSRHAEPPKARKFKRWPAHVDAGHAPKH